MMNTETYDAILDSINCPIVFVDNNHIIRYLNKSAKIQYYEKRGYSDLIGKSLFECHNPASEEQIKRLHGRLLAGEDEIFLMVNKNHEKITFVGVRDGHGELLGYYELFDKANEPAASADD